MRYAIIGCGRIAVNHVAAALNNHLDIVALCDIDYEHMENLLPQMSEHKEQVSLYSDYKEMIEKESLDLVAIATESGLHAEIALYCIKHHIHVIIEKPMAMNMKDARAICDAATKYDVVVCANHQNRFNHAVQKVKEAVDENKFGKVFYATAHVRWNRNENYYTQAKWRGTWLNDGGCLMNQCIHNADLIRWLMGNEIDEVMAYTDRMNHDYIEAEDFGMAMIRFKNGSYGLFEGTVNVYPKNLEETLYIFGRDGTTKIGGTSTNKLEEWMFPGEDNSEEFKAEYCEQPTNVYGFGHTRLYEDVMDAIKHHRKPLVDEVAGMQALELVLAIYQSAASGKAVKLPLGDVSSLDFEERFDS